MDLDDLLSLAEAAADLGIAPATLRHQAQVGHIRARNIGKTWITTRQEVDRYRAEHLGRVGRPSAESVNERLRAAFIAGAEEDSRRRLGRGLTPEELERVLRRYPGDL